jgi:hypothetical protein
LFALYTFYRVHWLPAVFNPCVDFFSYLFFYRITCSLSHAPTFRRKGLFQLIWPLLYLKPLRLKKIRTEMMPKNQKKTPAQRHRLLLRSLKTLLRTRRVSVSTTLHLRVPLREQRLIKPLFWKKILNISTSWHRKCSSSSAICTVLALFLSCCT